MRLRGTCVVLVIFSLVLFAMPTTYANAQEVDEYIETDEYAQVNKTFVTNMEYVLVFQLLGERHGLFTGYLVDGLPNGHGIFKSQSPEGIAWVYEGEFVNGHFNGEGVLQLENGDRQEGTFRNSVLRNGRTLRDGVWYDTIDGYTEGLPGPLDEFARWSWWVLLAVCRKM